MGITSFKKYQDNRDANVYRESQAQALLELYRRQNGHGAANMEALTQWCQQTDLSAFQTNGKIDPSKVFS
jgi:hypothetical protein